MTGGVGEMGLVHPGIPHEIVLFLKQQFGLESLVETGTLDGYSAAWASRYFKRVVTIEASEPLWRAARARHAQIVNVEFIWGNSAQQLPALIPRFENPLFWLDAHWSGGHTAGESDECPLLAELAAISMSQLKNKVIIIDDARLFLTPPPAPHKWEHWPDLSTVISALEACGNPYVVVTDDVVIAVPSAARGAMVDYLRGMAGRGAPSLPTVPPLRHAGPPPAPHQPR
jgi:hypothetical protein